MKRTLIVHQVTIEEHLEREGEKYPNGIVPAARRCRIDFCGHLLRNGGEWCQGGHYQYEIPRGAKAPVFPGAIDGRGL